LPKLTSRSTKRVLKALGKAGWTRRPINPGSRHYVLVNPDIPGILTVPRHNMVKKGTLGKIIKQAGLTLVKFEKLYY